MLRIPYCRVMTVGRHFDMASFAEHVQRQLQGLGRPVSRPTPRHWTWSGIDRAWAYTRLRTDLFLLEDHEETPEKSAAPGLFQRELEITVRVVASDDPPLDLTMEAGRHSAFPVAVTISGEVHMPRMSEVRGTGIFAYAHLIIERIIRPALADTTGED